MLFSIGYQKMKDVDVLIEALRPHGIKTLVDVRSQPNGRKTQFNLNHLARSLPEAGIEYLWWGKTLGGFAKIEEESIQSLAKWQAGEVACLMCMEADPDKCHRKYEIGRRLEAYGVVVRHLPLPVTTPQGTLF